MNAFLVASGGLLAGAALLSIPYARMRAHHAEAATELRDGFFEASHALLSDDDTPEVLVDWLEILAAQIDKPGFCRHLIRSALSGKFSARPNGVEDAPSLIRELEGLRPELARQAAKAFVCFVFASTYASPLGGWFARRVILFSARSNPTTAEYVVTKSVSTTRNGFPPRHAPA